MFQPNNPYYEELRIKFSPFERDYKINQLWHVMHEVITYHILYIYMKR